MITKSTSGWIALAAVLTASTFVAGCGDNVADNGADPIENPEIAAPTGVDPSAEEETSESDEWAMRQQQLDERMRALEQREAEIAQRERQAARQREAAELRVSEPPVVRDPEPAVREVEVTLPASTALAVEFTSGLSSDESVAGDPVRVVVVRDVVQDGRVAVPAGSQVSGQVAEVKSGRKIGGRSRVVLEFDTLELPEGDRFPVRSTIEYAGKSQTGKDAATIGGSTAGGAILGRVLGGDDKDKSTAIGAVVGAAVGTAVAAKNGTDSVVIQTGDVAELLLYEPVRLNWRETVPATDWARN
ncbi:MAG TPA: hypothetical protein VD788_16530 [Candidatus Polarisedimenticolaceae bacterium]|nr:hypothetical protein [Candidatus Polarisedimenticolaceae bacterium]